MSDRYTLHHGDCIDVMRTMPDASVDAIVTDPPYELGFMGKSWDASGIAFNVDVWTEALRILKPGGHLLAFSGSRTYHRMAVAIEDAGFEIRDQIMWIYGSGFPKSLDVSKAIDKGSGENRERQLRFTAWMRSTGITGQQINDITGTNMGGHYLTAAAQPAIATAYLFDLLRPYLPEVPEEIERLVAERTGIEWPAYTQREVTGTHTEWTDRSNYAITAGDGLRRDIPATTAAREWQGWGTALKPAHEPIVVARKPLIGTVAANVLTLGVGALNIDGTRVKAEEDAGRWPANVIHDGSDEVVALFPQSNGGAFPAKSNVPTGEHYEGGWGTVGNGTRTNMGTGSAARFFYCAKASRRDRNEGLDSKNHHPTVKPTELMRYLIRLVTPRGAVVLDPFMGSGSTGKAAMYEGVRFIGIEQDADYLAIAQARIEFAITEPLEDVIFPPARDLTDDEIAELANPTLFGEDEASA